MCKSRLHYIWNSTLQCSCKGFMLEYLHISAHLNAEQKNLTITCDNMRFYVHITIKTRGLRELTGNSLILLQHYSCVNEDPHPAGGLLLLLHLQQRLYARGSGCRQNRGNTHLTQRWWDEPADIHISRISQIQAQRRPSFLLCYARPDRAELLLFGIRWACYNPSEISCRINNYGLTLNSFGYT